MLGNILKRTRQERHLSQAVLAEAIGTTPTTISRIETGKQIPSVAIVAALADFFGVSIGYLTGRMFHPEDIPRDVRELCELVVKAGTPVNLKNYLKFLAVQKASEQTGTGNAGGNDFQYLFPGISESDWRELARKFDEEFILKLARIPAKHREALTQIVRAFYESITPDGEEASLRNGPGRPPRARS